MGQQLIDYFKLANREEFECFNTKRSYMFQIIDVPLTIM